MRAHDGDMFDDEPDAQLDDLAAWSDQDRKDRPPSPDFYHASTDDDPSPLADLPF